MPIIVIAGEEELLISEKIETLKKDLLDPNWQQINYVKFVHPDLKTIIDAAAQIPFGPGNKFILLDNCDLFTKKKNKSEQEDSGSSTNTKSKQDKTLDSFEHALKNLAANTYLIFSSYNNFDKTLKISKIIEKHAEIHNFEKIKYWAGSTNNELQNFCRKRAHKYNVIIDDEAVDYLAESTECNLRMISMEIEKAATFIFPEKKISLEIVSYLSPHHSSVFSLLDHWLSNEKQKVIENIQEILSRQNSAIPIFAIIQTTLSKWIGIKIAAEKILTSLPAGRGIQRRELPSHELAKRLQTEIKMNPWVLKMDLERVSKISLPHLIEKKQEITRLENSIKSGTLPDDHALNIFFTN